MIRFLTTLLGLTVTLNVAAGELRLATFEIDATPEIGSPLAYDPMRETTQPLSCKGVILLSEEQPPIVLCSVDWLGVANESGDAFRESLAAAVGTLPSRVAVHALHQHDAPRCDLSAARILNQHGIAGQHYDVPFIHRVIGRAGRAANKAIKEAKPVTDVRFATAVVEKVASNRRMLGPDGKVHTTRYTACKDPTIRALPTGVIDPKLKLVRFSGEQGPLAALTFYATHPQSYYRTGGANPDFPGMARNARQAATGVFHLHFNGAGGNIGAGKYNDGSRQNRAILANRVAQAMELAWEATQADSGNDPTPNSDLSWDWSHLLIDIPLADHLSADALTDLVASPETPYATRSNAAAKLAFLQRVKAGKKTQLSRLRIGQNDILFMPGELFVEYQLAGQEMRPDRNVLMAAYGEYGTQYIGTRVSFAQGGYETSDRATNVSPAVEAILLQGMRSLLDAEQSSVTASEFTERTGTLPPNAD